MAYAELIVRSNFTFLEGASHPEELVAQSHALGLAAVALTDRDSLAGVVRAHQEAKRQRAHLLVGAELTLHDAPPLIVLARDLHGYENLCELISLGRLACPKGGSLLRFESFEGRTEGLTALDVDAREPAQLHRVRDLFGEHLHVAVWNHLTTDCASRLEFRERLAKQAGVPVVATNPAVMHDGARQRLQDVLTCIRHGVTIREAGRRLFPNAERRLKSERDLRRLFRGREDWVDRSAAIAASCHFTLDELRYRFPEEMLPPGTTPTSFLSRLVREGLARRYPGGVPGEVQRQTTRELSLIEDLGFEGYFLTVWDIVRFARERGILCQGRGSAANSIVCYALEITSIDPVRMDLLFERFISRERNEPPDIDVDFEHERREEVLQYVYEKYGRDRAAMVAEVISYRSRLALRDVGKVLGLAQDQVDGLARAAGYWGQGPDLDALAGLGLDLRDLSVRTTLQIAEELEGFPRHLSIHSGGFVVTRERLARLVPIENGAMEGRTVIQWDKDDAAAAGLLKIDLLSLGMLSLIARAFALIRRHCGTDYTLATIPSEDPAVYDMLCEADTIGVFQIESRAQMNMLPRLKPRTFYDLVIEVAIIRPGPIQGGMIHPYLRRRSGQEQVEYPHPSLKPILQKTLGVPLFQEQGMKLAVVAAGFTPGEADELRRAMTHKRSKEKLEEMKERLVSGMGANGIDQTQAEAIFQQLLGFAGYGFPESHSASFALLVYASSYLKHYYPAVFAASLLNAQPMGFYAPHTIVDDARRHGVAVRPVDVFYSDRECTLEEAEEGEGLRPEDLRANPHWLRRPRKEGLLAVRLGLGTVRGLRAEHAERIATARRERAFESLADLAKRAALPRHVLARLAAAGALEGFGLGRREALWRIQALPGGDDLFGTVEPDEAAVSFDEGDQMDRVAQDYATTGLSLERHPMAVLRPRITTPRVIASDRLQNVPGGRNVRVGGMVVVRQRPGTARGIVFVTLEDEVGFTNLVVMPDVWDRDRRIASGALFLAADGVVERNGRVVTVKVDRLFPLEFESNSIAAPEARNFR